MIPGGTCENGITVLFSAAGFLHIWKVVMRSGLDGITVCVFYGFPPILLEFLLLLFFLPFYAFICSLFVCKHAKCSFAIYEGSWFSSCKCNALINPLSKTSSRQAVSINWGERQQGLILWQEIPLECRVAEWGSSSEKRSQFWGNEWLVWFCAKSSCNWMWCKRFVPLLHGLWGRETDWAFRTQWRKRLWR